MKFSSAFKVLAPLVAGILLAEYFSTDIPVSLLFILISLLITLTVLRKWYKSFSNYSFIVILNLLFLSSGIYIRNESKSIAERNHFSHALGFNPSHYVVKIVESPQRGKDWIKVKSEVIEIDNQKCQGKLLTYFKNDGVRYPEYGDIINISGNIFTINKPKNPYEFDYQNFMFRKDIYHQAYIQTNQWSIQKNEANPIINSIYKLKDYCTTIINNSFLNEENKSLIKALVLGDKTTIEDDTLKQFSSSGIIHILAVSGLHVGIIMLILNFVFKPLSKLKGLFWLAPILVISCIWFYAILTGFTPSVFRASVMFTFVAIGLQLERETSIYQSLIISALILILIQPTIIFEIGFLLSYTAVIGIVYIQPKIYTSWYLKNKFLDKIWQLASVSIAAQIATLPLTIYYFHNFPVYFLFANLIAIPIAFILLALTIAALVSSFIPIISNFLFFIINVIGMLFLESIGIIDKLPVASLGPFTINLPQVILLFVLILILFSTSKFKVKKVAISLSLLMIIGMINFSNFMNLQENKNVTFYSIKEMTVIDIFTKNHLSSFQSESDHFNSSKFDFHIKENRIQMNRSFEANSTQTLKNGDVIAFENKTMLFISGNITQSSCPRTDLIYLTNCSFFPNELLRSLINDKTYFIFGNGCKSSTINYLSSLIPKNQRHELLKQGAINFNFD